MKELEEMVAEMDVNLEDCVVFIKEKNVLTVGIENIKIMQRSDEIMAVKFSIAPDESKTLTDFFSPCQNGEKIYMNIALTGNRLIYYRGLSPIKKEIGSDAKFSIILITQKSTEVADESYISSTCSGCEFCHI